MTVCRLVQTEGQDEEEKRIKTLLKCPFTTCLGHPLHTLIHLKNHYWKSLAFRKVSGTYSHLTSIGALEVQRQV